MMRDRMRVLDFCKLAAILAVMAVMTAAAASAANPCPSPPPCGDHCSNYPYQPTECWTTPYGPAKADIITSPTNLLYCEGNKYALCFFSGPPTPSGTSSSNNPLPCVLNPNGTTANCTCQAYTSGANFVDINGILNRGVYFETVRVCGQDGSRCKNMASCGPTGDESGCKAHLTPPVCKYLQEQNPVNPKFSLMPKADLISTFSLAMSPKDGPYQLGSTSCNSGLYAGCMTAPCFRKKGQTSPLSDGEEVQCECPTYKGVYQVGQKCQDCLITGGSGSSTYVWSASNTVKKKGGGQ